MTGIIDNLIERGVINPNVGGITGSTIALLSSSYKPNTAVVEKTVKTKEEIKRVDTTKLELCYIRDPLANAGVDFTVETFMSTDYKVVASRTKDQKILNEFLANCDFYDLLTTIVKDCCIYGNAYIEKLYSKRNKLITAENLDAKSIDFLRDNEGRIIWDTYKKPKEYVQYIDDLTGFITTKKTITSYGRTAIPILPKYIGHYTTSTIGGNPSGMGIIEPVYNIIIQKNNMEKSYAQACYEGGFGGNLVVTIGDQTHQPRPNDIEAIREDLQSMNEKTKFVVPWNYNFEYLKKDFPKVLKEHLSYYVDQEITGMRIPKPLVTGSGEQANRSTVEKQTVMYMRRMEMMQKRISKQLESNLFSVLAKDYSFSKVPRISWEDIEIESLTSKAERLNMYLSNGLLEITPALKTYVEQMENLPTDTEDIDLEPESYP